jgi:galactokinase
MTHPLQIGTDPESVELVDRFQEHFGTRPSWCVRAPGRVNLIGDHTDYNRLPVFPMAIQRAVHIVGRSRSGSGVRLVNVDARFPPCDFAMSAKLHPEKQSWWNYVMAGARALAEQHGARHGFDAVVSSTIPIASGLSSSSALVVAAGLASARANDIYLEPLVMADLMANAERFVGTMGGGMDQAVCLGGASGFAVEIGFSPLTLRPVEVPEGWRFVVAHSLQPAEKSGAVQAAYNRRTTDCRLALELVVKTLQWESRQPDGPGYRELVDNFGSHGLIRVAEGVLDRALLARFRHTVSEGERVRRAVSAMSVGAFDEFGRLMLESHSSLRNDYEVSTAALDELVERLVQHGAVGARITGAGFGGCAVGLCASDQLETMIAGVKRSFYDARSTPDVADRLFECVPSDGAQVYDL